MPNDFYKLGILTLLEIKQTSKKVAEGDKFDSGGSSDERYRPNMIKKIFIIFLSPRYSRNAEPNL